MGFTYWLNCDSSSTVCFKQHVIDDFGIQIYVVLKLDVINHFKKISHGKDFKLANMLCLPSNAFFII